MTAHGTPEGYTSLTPFLCVSDGAAAISFYTEVFGAELVSKMELPTGGIAHAELQFATGRLQLADAMPEYELAAPDDGPLRLDPRPARPSLDDHDPGRGGQPGRGRTPAGRVVGLFAQLSDRLGCAANPPGRGGCRREIAW